MSVCNVQTLISENPCYSALSPWVLETIKTQILCNLKNLLETGTAVTCDIQTLLNDAKCFYNVQPFVLSVLQTQLLCDISNLISGGGGVAGFLSGSGDPEGVVTGVVVGQTYLDTSTGTSHFFNGTPGTNTGWI